MTSANRQSQLHNAPKKKGQRSKNLGDAFGEAGNSPINRSLKVSEGKIWEGEHNNGDTGPLSSFLRYAKSRASAANPKLAIGRIVGDDHYLCCYWFIFPDRRFRRPTKVHSIVSSLATARS
ncbi:hypothetical protein N7478_006580 [Penicillium angulare]|uniref:uncharacterized protein n=1 Tax=Penicillium angulare TaxID=116970 RepID=UPI002541A5BF|nr:uncharacterized protein N7478_006580 [Penicillium angulare]KAJ5281208.1 hypothetical protein N7478_006580 [Penicillium angulare]